MTLATVKPPVLARHQVIERLLLTMSAGAVNAGAFLACQRFVSHVTGTVTLVGIDFGRWSLLGEYLLVLMCFLLGAMTAMFLLARAPADRYPVGSLRLVAFLVALVAPLGIAGVFGPFGKTVESPGDFVLLSLLSFAMGLLNATVAGSSTMSARVTHMTGHATELGITMARVFLSRGDERKRALQRGGLLAGKFFCFSAGAALMVFMVRWGGYAAFLSASALTVLAGEIGRLAREAPERKPKPSWRAEPSYNKVDPEYTPQPSH